MTVNEIAKLAERCLSMVRGLDENREDDARDAIGAGEPEYAIAAVLDIAYDRPSLYAQFPDEVYELAKDPDCMVIHRYLDLLEKYREK